MREVWRCLLTKLALSVVSASTRKYLLPFQLGVAMKGVMQAITHLLNHFMAGHSYNEGLRLLKVNLTNAFNLISMRAFWEGVCQLFPSLSSWMECCYRCQVLLFVASRLFFVIEKCN